MNITAEFRAQADNLLAAVQAGDQPQAAQAAAALAGMKKTCHGQHK